MNRLLGCITVGLALAAGCSDSQPDKVTIKMFQAAPDAIELGQSAKLVFVVDPPDAELSIEGVGSLSGQTQAMVSPTATRAYRLVATNGHATTESTATVTVGPQTAVALKLEPATASPTAGNPTQVTVTALAATGKTASGYRGTVHLSSSDPKAELPADLVFTASDAGVKFVMVMLKTAGPVTVTGADIANPVTRGTASLSVAAAAASTCVASQAPAASTAGSVVGMTVALRDPFGNTAASYAGTMQLTATDPRALLPAPTTYTAGDAGSHAFSAVLLTAGSQALTASDTANAAIHCSAAIAVAHAAPRLVLGLPSDANAGYPVTVSVTAKDLFDNPIPNYAAKVTFTSTDTGTGAAAPAPITFTGSEGGIASTSATFVTLGAQTLAASDNGTPVAIGSAASAVHGLVYAGPTTGRVRLVANAAQSTTQLVQLDLVANERLEVSSFFGGGPGSFAAGMNLPLQTSRAAADATLFIAGNALPLGTGTPAAIGRIGTDQILYTGVSRKRQAGTIFSQETEVAAGRVFYSVRLKLQPGASVGPVFDGAQPSSLFRASVRDQYGDDFVSQSDFGIGKLEVR
jgi:hypothetical protein